MVNIAKLPDRESPAGYVAGEVRAHLARQGWSGSRLARELQITQAAMSRRLTGDIAFDAAELIEIGRLLGVHPGAFFPGYEPTAPAPGIELSPDEQRVVLALRSTAPSGRGGASRLSHFTWLPDLDSNQEPIG